MGVFMEAEMIAAVLAPWIAVGILGGLGAFVIVLVVTGFFCAEDLTFARFVLFGIAAGYWVVHLIN